ncbi:hypothetical protein HYS93_00665 [Candidatus Daviesbacteria bacterium]|nr:hypothetical protein [Candidatus Daviesbacteria bacterium]
MRGKEKIILIVIAVLIILIPSGSFILSKRINQKNAAKTTSIFPQTSPKEVPKTNPIDELKKSLLKESGGSDGSSSLASSSAEISFGPTLKFKINLEGRPKNKQATKLFVGIAQGQPITNPQYLLSFTVNVPDSGEYSNLSLAGLTQSQTYTAYLKGSVQIATASAFTVKPSVNDLNTLNLLTGDLNEDNTINTLDYNITLSALGANPTSKKWNPLIDFNLDNSINSFDIGFIIKNLGKTGTSGTWYSPTPPASKSAELKVPANTGSEGDPPASGGSGYWIWVPKF